MAKTRLISNLYKITCFYLVIDEEVRIFRGQVSEFSETVKAVFNLFNLKNNNLTGMAMYTLYITTYILCAMIDWYVHQYWDSMVDIWIKFTALVGYFWQTDFSIDLHCLILIVLIFWTSCSNFLGYLDPNGIEVNQTVIFCPGSFFFLLMEKKGVDTDSFEQRRKTF